MGYNQTYQQTSRAMLTTRPLYTMERNSSPSSEETDARLLEALASLNQISYEINQISSSDLERHELTLKLIVESAIRVVTGSSAVIYTYDHVTGTLERESRVSVEQDGNPSANIAPDDLPRSGGMGMRTIQRRRKTLSYEEKDIEIHPYHVAQGVKAVACYPLSVAGQVVGVLYVYLYEEREFTPLEQLMLDNFVNQAAMAIYHARHLGNIRRDLAHKESELKRLRRAGMLISSRLGLEETLDSILQLAMEVTNARYGIFRLMDREGEFLVTSAVKGADLERPFVEKLPLHGNSIMACVARSREAILIPDTRVEPWSKVYYPLDSSLEMRSELAVPLINASGRLEGVLNVESPNPSAFNEDDNHILQTLATYAITAIQEVRLLDALQEIARLLISQPEQKVLDHLTLVANDLLNSSSSAIWSLTSQNELTLITSNGSFQHMEKVTLNESLVGQAILRRKNLTLGNIRSDSPFYSNGLLEAQQWSRVLIMPLLTGDDGRALGAFGIFNTSTDGGHFAESEWDEKILTCLAHYAVLAMQNESRQQALRASHEQHLIAETFAAVGDISANLLHNMNNKVGTIPVRVQTIQDKYSRVLESDTYLAKNLAEIERSATDAMKIVQENLSHLRPIRIERVLVSSCVTDAIQSAQLSPEIKVDMTELEHLPKVVAGTKSLTLVFKNLIENAADAMGGRGTISIRGTSNAGLVEVFVSDSGPGIAPELHDAIFELDFSGRAAHPGKLGFGLWWVKTLMTRLGGSVAVKSDGKHGTTFLLRLPCAEETP
jgi:signal transduction histidine kinase/putative methionine-R-sulfoxide reductase with GAF domain